MWAAYGSMDFNPRDMLPRMWSMLTPSELSTAFFAVQTRYGSSPQVLDALIDYWCTPLGLYRGGFPPGASSLCRQTLKAAWASPHTTQPTVPHVRPPSPTTASSSASSQEPTLPAQCRRQSTSDHVTKLRSLRDEAELLHRWTHLFLTTGMTRGEWETHGHLALLGMKRVWEDAAEDFWSDDEERECRCKRCGLISTLLNDSNDFIQVCESVLDGGDEITCRSRYWLPEQMPLPANLPSVEAFIVVHSTRFSPHRAYVAPTTPSRSTLAPPPITPQRRQQQRDAATTTPSPKASAATSPPTSQRHRHLMATLSPRSMPRPLPASSPPTSGSYLSHRRLFGSPTSIHSDPVWGSTLTSQPLACPRRRPLPTPTLRTQTTTTTTTTPHVPSPSKIIPLGKRQQSPMNRQEEAEHMYQQLMSSFNHSPSTAKS